MLNCYTLFYFTYFTLPQQIRHRMATKFRHVVTTNGFGHRTFTLLLFTQTLTFAVSSILIIAESVCLFLRSLCTACFERIWAKFGMWHPYTLRVVIGWLPGASTRRLTLCAPAIYEAENGRRAPLGNSQLAGGRRNGSAAGARNNRAPYGGGWSASNILFWR